MNLTEQQFIELAESIDDGSNEQMFVDPDGWLRDLYKALKASPASAPEDVIDAVTIALRKAFQLGQTYWQQADSDYISQNKKSDDTYAKFLVLSEEISAMLAAAPTPPSTEDRKDAERLNWLDEHGMIAIGHKGYGEYRYYAGDLFPAIRQVIDQAMQEDKP